MQGVDQIRTSAKKYTHSTTLRMRRPGVVMTTPKTMKNRSKT